MARNLLLLVNLKPTSFLRMPDMTLLKKGIGQQLIGPTQLILAAAVIVGLGLAATLNYFAEYQHFRELERLGRERLDLYASTLEALHKRFDYLPFIISGDTQVKRLLNRGEAVDAVNSKLHAWQLESGASELYLMDRQGVVLASSNWQRAESFVGRDYHFRPYFRDAIVGRRGQFFGIGVTTGRPGLFLSRPIEHEQEIVGVAVVKVDMTTLEKDWASGGENVWVSDQDGVIFLASNPDWKYRSLDALEHDTLVRLSREKKYSGYRITPLDITQRSSSPQAGRIIHFSGEDDAVSPLAGEQSYLLHDRAFEAFDWTLYYLTSLEELSDIKRISALVSLLVAILIALLGFILANRIQNRQLLEQRVASRTQALNETNQRLVDEINGRIKTEEQLHQTHEELIQAEKLAALGQMSAGLVHEISQPLSAMQTFIASTRLFIERNENESATENLNDIESMVRRVNSIVSHLKGFARKSKRQSARIAVQGVIDNALLILNSRLSKSEVQLEWTPPPTPVYVMADEIRLEQILINLIRNALDAMEAAPSPHRLTIGLSEADGRVSVIVHDTGPGIADDDLPRLFDPFFTTKKSGEGLGLGLSVSCGIAREFGGKLEAMNHADGGSVFELSLEAA